MRCDIIIPVWNMKVLTEQCLNSIIRHTKFPYRILIVDNASDDETRSYLEDFSKRQDVRTLLIRNEENLGYGKAANQGMRASDAEYICILNNDTLVTDNWLKEMVNVSLKDPQIGIVNPFSNYGSRKPAGRTWQDISRDIYEKKGGTYIETAAASGFCFLVKRSVIDKIGLWREDYEKGYFEDTEHSIRAVKSGYKIAIAQGAYVVHLERSSFEKSGLFHDTFEKNRNIFNSEFGRSKRLLYILTGRDDFGITDSAYTRAQNRDWIWVFLRKGQTVKLPRHAYIKMFHMDRLFFQLNCIFRVLKRKKRFDIIYSDSPSLSRKLELLRSIHKAEVRQG